MSVRASTSAARPGRAYRFNQSRPVEKKTYYGNHFANESLVMVRKLCWSKPDGRSATTIRVLPGTDGDNPGEWGPLRLSEQPDDFGDWIRAYTMCRLGTTDAATFITHDPADREYNLFHNPGRLVWSGVQYAVKNKCDQTGWAALLEGGQGRAAALVPPKTMYLVRCVVVEYGPETIAVPQGLGAGDRVVLMDLGKMAGQEMIGLVNQVVEGTEHEDEPQYVLPDPLAIDGGVFFRFFPKEQDPRKLHAAPAAARSMAARVRSAPALGGGGKGFEDKGFGCYTLDRLEDGLTPELSEFSAALYKKMPAWDDILVFMTEEEQARLVAKQFDLSILDYCWRDHPEFLAIAREVHSTRQSVPADLPRTEVAPAAPAAPAVSRRAAMQAVAAAAQVSAPADPAPSRPWQPPADEFGGDGAATPPVHEPAAVVEAAATVAPDTAAIAEKTSKLDDAKRRWKERNAQSA